MTSLDTVVKNLLRLPEIESWFLDHLARSPSPYRTKYPGFLLFWFNIYVLWPPLWSSGQSPWLQIQRSDSRRDQIFWEVVGLERGPLSLLSTIEELLGRNNSGFGLENREYDRGDQLRWPRDTLYPQKLTLTSPTSGGRSIGIVRLRLKATEFFLHSFFPPLALQPNWPWPLPWNFPFHFSY
jgi:hypothetical protein